MRRRKKFQPRKKQKPSTVRIEPSQNASERWRERAMIKAKSRGNQALAVAFSVGPECCGSDLRQPKSATNENTIGNSPGNSLNFQPSKTPSPIRFHNLLRMSAASQCDGNAEFCLISSIVRVKP